MDVVFITYDRSEKYLKSNFFKKNKNKNKQDQEITPDQMMKKNNRSKLTGKLDETIQIIKSLLGENDDFVIRHFHIFGHYSAAMVYLSHIVDHEVVNRDILKPLMNVPNHLVNKMINLTQLEDVLLNETLSHSKTHIENDIGKLISALLHGKTVIVIEKLDKAFHIDTHKVEKRAVTQPETEQVILGPREGYIESIVTNLALLRNRLPTADLKVKTMTIGRLTKTKVAICYLKGIANESLIKEVEKRLSQIDIDVLLDVGYLEQFIEDNHYSPFPQIQTTERPDKTVASLAEGRVAIIADGSPFALIAPVVFHQFYQTTEDYSSRFLMGSFMRMARVLALVFSLFFPGIYVSMISFNPELIPTEFAVAVAGGRAGVPYPAVVEVLLMEVSMEVLREATVRLPRQVGGALSIVGVLVIGQAAVEAGFASPITVVFIALTTIGSFATPAYTAAFALRILRFLIIILAGIFGLYGVVVGVIFIFNHMLSLKSFGVPFMSPMSPGNLQGIKDTGVRAPLWWMYKRPSFLHPTNEVRLGTSPKPFQKAQSVPSVEGNQLTQEEKNEPTP